MNLDPKSRFYRLIALVALIALIVLFIAWFVFLIPPAHPITILSIHCVPLLLFLPSMIKARPQSFIWLCFVIIYMNTSTIFYNVLIVILSTNNTCKN